MQPKRKEKWYKYICMRQYSVVINILGDVSVTRKGSVKDANTELSTTAPCYVTVVHVIQDKAYFSHTRQTDQRSTDLQ